jgi:hypothetical protein
VADHNYVWVDLDQTLAEYKGWKGIHTIGQPHPGARKFMRDLMAMGNEKGFKVGVFTTRTKLDMPGRELLVEQFPQAGDAHLIDHLKGLVVQWLRMHQIPFDDVYTGQGKPAGLAYVDDRAVWCDPQSMGAPQAYEYALNAVKGILER